MNVSVETEEAILARMTNAAIQQRMPCIVFIGSLSLIGVIGNIHVLVLFPRSDRKPSTYTVFVIALAVVDLATCLFHMPMEIFDLTRPYTFYSEIGCKLFRFNNAFLLLSSTFILVLIALERYRRVCNPLRPQMTVSLSKKLCVLVICISLVLTWPMYVLNGHHTKVFEGNGANATGYMCFIEDEVRGTFYLYGYLGFIILVFIIAAGILIFTYVAISRVIFTRHASIRKGGHFSPNSYVNVSTVSLDLVTSQDTPVTNTIESFNNSSIHETTTSQKISMLKATRSLFLITTIFIILFTPYLLLNLIITLDKTFKPRLNDLELTVYQICFRLILVNNVCNPFVYGFTDSRFKNGMKEFYCCKKIKSCI